MEKMNQMREPDAKHWIFSLLDSLPHPDFVRLLMTLRDICHARRKAIHENEFQSPNVTHEFVERFLGEINARKITSTPQQMSNRQSAVSRCIPPPRGNAKLMVHGGVSRSSNVGSINAYAEISTEFT